MRCVIGQLLPLDPPRVRRGDVVASVVLVLLLAGASAAQTRLPEPWQLVPGLFEPSGVVALPDGRLLIVDDEDDLPLALLTLPADGAPPTVVAIDPREHFAKDGPHHGARKLNDLEGVAIDRAGRVRAAHGGLASEASLRRACRKLLGESRNAR